MSSLLVSEPLILLQASSLGILALDFLNGLLPELLFQVSESL